MSYQSASSICVSLVDATFGLVVLIRRLARASGVIRRRSRSVAMTRMLSHSGFLSGPLWVGKHISSEESTDMTMRTEQLAGTQERERLVYTVAEAGELLGISRAFAYELVARGELPVIRLGRRRLVPKVALLALVEGELPRDPAVTQ
jgi:excisionase family DNA binding protein